MFSLVNCTCWISTFFFNLFGHFTETSQPPSFGIIRAVTGNQAWTKTRFSEKDHFGHPDRLGRWWSFGRCRDEYGRKNRMHGNQDQFSCWVRLLLKFVISLSYICIYQCFFKDIFFCHLLIFKGGFLKFFAWEFRKTTALVLRQKRKACFY